MAATLQLTTYEVADSVNIQENTSRLYVCLQIVTTAGTYNHSGDTTGSLSVNGQAIPLDGKTVDYNTTTTLYEQTHTIVHTPDGSKTVTVAAHFDPNTPATRELAVTQTVVLTHIPRASTVAATDANIGGVSMIAVNRRAESYTHTLYWEFGRLSGWLAADGVLSQSPVQLTQNTVAFTLPESFYAQIPDSPTGICHLVCTTYLDGVQVAQPHSADFTVTADPMLCAPKGELSVVDVNPATIVLTGDETVMVRYASTARCSMAVTAKNGASIVSKSIAGTQITGDTLELPNFSEGEVACSATDSRGFGWWGNILCKQVAYIPLTANLTAGRTDPTSGRAVVQVRGNCFRGSFGAAENTLTVICRIGSQEKTLAPVFSEDTYEAAGEFSGLDYLQSHSVTLTVTDALGSVTRTAVIGKGIPVFDWGEEDFRFHVPVSVPEPSDDAHAVNKAFAVAKTGDTMTGPLAAPLLLAQSDEFPGLQICRGDGSVMASVVASDYHGRLYLSNNRGEAYEAFFTPAMTPGRTDGGIYYLLTSKEPVTVEQGGTGAADAFTARWNLGIRCDSLLAMPLEDINAQQPLVPGYKGYLVMGCPRSGSSTVTQFIPTAALTESAVQYQLADNTDYCAFQMWHVGGTPAIRRSAGTGVITAVFGIN